MSLQAAAFFIDGLTFFLLFKLDTLYIDIANVVGDLQQQEVALHCRCDVDHHILPLCSERNADIRATAPVA